MKHASKRLKHRFKSLLKPLALRVRSGPLKGYRWSMATGWRFISGTYEPFKTRAYLDTLRPGDVVIDVGAHVGYYALLASAVVGAEGQVMAFEPRPLNFGFLERHIRLNRVGNIRLWEAGVSNDSGRSRFETRTGTGTGRLSREGDINVRTVRLDDLFLRGDLPHPDFMKIDVEGGEMAVLEGSMQLIRQTRPTLLVATHGREMHDNVTTFLDALGYEYRILDPQGHSGDTEILARVPSRPAPDLVGPAPRTPAS